MISEMKRHPSPVGKSDNGIVQEPLAQLPEERREEIVQQAAAQLDVLPQPAAEIVKQTVSQPPFSVTTTRTVGLDNSTPCCYILLSIPAGPLSQDMLSLGGSFIGGRV